jgi:hypothetical protein
MSSKIYKLPGGKQTKKGLSFFLLRYFPPYYNFKLFPPPKTSKQSCEAILKEDKMMAKLALSLMFLFLLSPLSFAGDIWVYDANNQKLGIAISGEGQGVFLPSLNRSTGIVWYHRDTKKIGRFFEYRYTLHQDSSCIEPPGAQTDVSPGYIYSFKILHKSPFYAYYDFDPAKLTKYGYRLGNDGVCRSTGVNGSNGFPLIVVPKEDIPFKTPIAFPIKLRYE